RMPLRRPNQNPELAQGIERKMLAFFGNRIFGACSFAFRCHGCSLRSLCVESGNSRNSVGKTGIEYCPGARIIHLCTVLLFPAGQGTPFASFHPKPEGG